MTDKRETPASTGSQRDATSRSTTKRTSRAKNATVVETNDQRETSKAPARKRATGDTVARRAPKVKVADAASTLTFRADSTEASTRAEAEMPAAAQPAAATSADEQRDSSPEQTTEREISPMERRAMIARVAYFRAQWRGWTPGAELDDWLHAEREVDAMLRGDYDA